MKLLLLTIKELALGAKAGLIAGIIVVGILLLIPYAFGWEQFQEWPLILTNNEERTKM